jgi:hypothetical protein
MKTTIRFRAAFAATVLAPVLLSGCAPAAAGAEEPSLPVEPDSGIGTTDPALLDYPFLVEPETAIPSWRSRADLLEGQLLAWNAECTPADATYGTPCTTALDHIRLTVGDIFQQWWALDDANWESGEFSGLVALKPTRDATLAARDSGRAWAEACEGIHADAEECEAGATAFHADVTTLSAAFSAWRG